MSSDRFTTQLLRRLRRLAPALMVLSAGSVSAETRVAFTGDQGVGDGARAVLSLVASEGADLLLIQGDLGYDDNTADRWEAHLNEFLGPDFPVLTLVGNHENFEWPTYKRYIRERIDRVPGLQCDGDTGVKATCRFDALDVLQVAPGIDEVDGVDGSDDYAGYLRGALANASADRWQICAWHKNQNAMQVGQKIDATGWAVYDACLDAGAMVVMGHSHTYSRTHLLSDFSMQRIVHADATMRLERGRSFAVVSGLGGRDPKAQSRGGEHFASIYTASQGATHGALFCDFGETRADCWFKAVDGAVPDRFTIERAGGSTAGDAESEEGDDGGYVFSRTDKDELWWIFPDGAGGRTAAWVDGDCAGRLDDAPRRGDWNELVASVATFGTAPGLCDTYGPATRDRDAGYVFARTDADEFRWIAPDDDGRWGSIWIDRACADRFGGATVRGDWAALMRSAPGFDAIESPCG